MSMPGTGQCPGMSTILRCILCNMQGGGNGQASRYCTFDTEGVLDQMSKWFVKQAQRCSALANETTPLTHEVLVSSTRGQ